MKSLLGAWSRYVVECEGERSTRNWFLEVISWSILPGDTTDCGYRITSNENSKVFIDQLILPITSTFMVPSFPCYSI